MTRRKPAFALGIIPEVQRLEDAFKLAEIADTGGIDYISAYDHPYLPDLVDTLTLLTSLGTRTQHVRILPTVFCLPVREPAVLAKAALTLDLITSGRFELGLGAGAYWNKIVTYGGPLRDPASAVAALDEAITVIRALWGQQQPGRLGELAGPVSFEGKYYTLHDASPGPLPAHPIGIWLGALKPRLARLIGQRCDGWTVTNTYLPPDQVLPLQKIIDEAALEAGRDPAVIQRWYNLWGVIQKPGYSPQPVTEIDRALIAPVEVWVEQIVSYYTDLGMEIFDFWPSSLDWEQQARLFTEEVVPAVRAALK